MTDDWQSELLDNEARPSAPADVAATAQDALAQDAAAQDAPAPADAPMASEEAFAQEVPTAQEAKLPAAKIATLRAVLKNMREAADAALRLIDDPDLAAAAPESAIGLVQAAIPASLTSVSFSGDRVVEGVFDGEGMVGDDGKTYLVPPNYASKSKLVEGDMMKLTIGPRGNFIYKQIGPIDRQRVVGVLAYEQSTGHFLALSGGRSWRLLKASVTYFKGDAGDEVVMLIPSSSPSKWAAVENIIKKVPVRA